MLHQLSCLELRSVDTACEIQHVINAGSVLCDSKGT